MKDLKDLIYEEQQILLEQMQMLLEESSNSIDIFMQSFDELAKNWYVVLKEFETTYSFVTLMKILIKLKSSCFFG